jgi:hypothetical protein
MSSVPSVRRRSPSGATLPPNSLKTLERHPAVAVDPAADDDPVDDVGPVRICLLNLGK